jgi:hypothetical protein
MRQAAYVHRFPVFLVVVLMPFAVAEADDFGTRLHLSDAATTAWYEPPQVDDSETFLGSNYDFGTAGGSCLSRHWVRAEYLLWWTKGNTLPPLVTTSPDGTARTDAGVVGLSTTQSLFESVIDDEDRSGGRLNFGMWLDDCQLTALEGTLYSVGDDTGTGDFFTQTNPLAAAGTGLPILTRPFFNVQTNAEDAELVSFPNVVDGQIQIASSSELHSASATFRRTYAESCSGRVGFLAGYRFFRVREGLLIGEQLTVTEAGGLIAQGTEFEVYDAFEAKNDFHGGEFGIVAEYWQDQWTIEFLAKLALGNLHRETSVDGWTVTRTPPPGVIESTATGGLLALSSNIGTRDSDTLAALPEFGMNLQLRLTNRMSLQAGYSTLLLTDVYRTGQLIDRTVNPTYLPGAGPTAGSPRPGVTEQETDFWAHGLNLALIWEG